MKADLINLTAHASELEHKAIKWSAPSWKGRDGAPQGVCIVHFVTMADQNPFHTTPVYGDLLDKAFWCGDTLCWNDASREVEFEFLND